MTPATNDPANGTDPEESTAMNFWDHVEDLRRALLRSLVGIALGITLVAFFFVRVFSWLRRPLDQALAEDPGVLNALTTTNVTGVFGVLAQVCMIGGIAVGAPFVLYNLGRFVGPGLTPKEKAILLPACLATLILFILGGLFAYFIVLPAALTFTLYLNNLLGLDTLWTAQSYYSFVAWSIIAVGVAFEFPLVVVILQYLGMVSPAQLRSGRRYAIMGIVVMCSLITPGDPFSTIFLMIPMFLFYEGAILIGSTIVKRRAEEEAAYDDDYTA